MASSVVFAPKQGFVLSARASSTVRGARVTKAQAAGRATAGRSRASLRVRAAIVDPPKASIKDVQRPDASGRYGVYGGKYVPETLIPALLDLEAEYAKLASDEDFQVSLAWSEVADATVGWRSPPRRHRDRAPCVAGMDEVAVQLCAPKRKGRSGRNCRSRTN